MATAELGRVFAPILLTLKTAGLWPSGDTYSIAYRIYEVLVLLVFSACLSLTMMIQLLGFTEMENLAEGMYMALTEFVCLLKMMNFAIRWKLMRKAFRLICAFELESDDERTHFNGKMRGIYFVTILLQGMANLANLSLTLQIILAPGYSLTYPAWYPGRWSDGGVKYWLVFGHQMIGDIFTSNWNPAIEMFSNAMLLVVSVQMDILGKRLSVIGYDVDDTELDPFQKRSRHLQTLKNCVQLHRQIVALSISVFFRSKTNFS